RKNRALDKELAKEVAIQLTEHNALEAHARDELGINEMTEAKPMQAALASGSSFLFGGSLPLLLAVIGSMEYMVYLQYAFATVFLAVLGIVAARTGGSNKLKAVIRITFWGTVAMGITALIGHYFGLAMA
ncbi:MAG: VIT1/CCC1 transporter family protein, partial [Bacteroidetes bacterium]|nr:VIT1/CCC1 transporter family protein [Bacteroidota bacterium]